MTLTNPLSTTEYLFIGLFALLYIAYFYRFFRAAVALNTPKFTIAFKFIIRTIYFSLFMVALMAPSFGDAKKEVKSVGKDIFIAVDLSESMQAFDIAPTRLEKMKYELKNMADALSSDRIGLIIFSSEAFIQCPLTLDQGAINLFVETLNTSLVPRKGTDFGPPLEIALQKFQKDRSSEGGQKSKVIVLISDGEDFGKNTADIVKEINKEGIKLFTLGIGTERGSKIRTVGGFKRDKQGNEVITRLDPSALKKIASDANGKYYEISEKRNDINRLINDIEAIEGEVREAFSVDIAANRYYFFLLVALCLMLIDFVLPLRLIKI